MAIRKCLGSLKVTCGHGLALPVTILTLSLLNFYVLDVSDFASVVVPISQRPHPNLSVSATLLVRLGRKAHMVMGGIRARCSDVSPGAGDGGIL